jgi:hypothetical protein
MFHFEYALAIRCEMKLRKVEKMLGLRRVWALGTQVLVEECIEQ